MFFAKGAHPDSGERYEYFECNVLGALLVNHENGGLLAAHAITSMKIEFFDKHRKDAQREDTIKWIAGMINMDFDLARDICHEHVPDPVKVIAWLSRNEFKRKNFTNW